MRNRARIILALLLLSSSMQAEEVYATFSVQADKSANLAFTSSGIVGSISVDVASVVKKGDILAQLQNSDLKAALNIANTSLKYEKKEYDRQLKVKHLLDASRLDGYAFKYENAKAQMEYQQALFDKTILKSPFDGVIYEKSVEVGDVVSGAMIRTIFKIQSLHKRKLILGFDQKYWSKIKAGQTFKYGVDGDSKMYRGAISKVYPYADSGNRKIKAEVEAKGFTPGLFGEGYILIDEKK
ncbi:MAG: efflux transporter periplasmic adaptor subunit [Sulfurovum sp.]|nr:MAG: efflux transporter periplasmic adaptor subunit [Sulfurovum sp.]